MSLAGPRQREVEGAILSISQKHRGAVFEKCQNCGARLVRGIRDEEGVFCSMECRNFFVFPGFCESCVQESSDESSGGTVTVNGVGTKLYGAKAPCETCGSIIQTQFFCVIFIPLIPLGRFRVKYTSPTQFYSRKVLPPPKSAPYEDRSEGLVRAGRLGRGAFLSQLNGWQRLFVVLAALWLIVVVAVAWGGLPREEQVWDRYADALIDRIRAGDEQLSTTSSYDIRKAYVDVAPAQLVSNIHGKYSAPEWRAYLADVDDEYRRELDELSTKQAQTLGWALVWWALPLAITYVLGRALGWVIAGFRRPAG